MTSAAKIRHVEVTGGLGSKDFPLRKGGPSACAACGKDWPCESAEAREIDDATAEFIGCCDRTIARSRETVVAYAKGIRSDPAHTLRSCDNLLEAAARIGVWTTVRDALASPTGKATLSTTREYARVEAMKHVSHVMRSTSTTGVLSHREAGAAWADVLEKLTWEGVK